MVVVTARYATEAGRVAATAAGLVYATEAGLVAASVRDLTREHPGLTFAWCDLDGVHCGAAPVEVPGATHLWGWGGGCALLARLEGSRVVAGLLLCRAAAGIPVTVRPMLPWEKDRHPYVAELPPELAAGLVTIEAPGPLELLGDPSWRQP